MDPLRLNFCFWAIICCLLYGCSGNKEILIDESLQAGSEKYKAKTRDGILDFGRSVFGPYTTINYSKPDSTHLKWRSDSFFDLYLFRHESSSWKRKVYTLDVANKTDTANVLFFVWVTTFTSDPGLFSRQETQTRSNIKDAEGEITFKNDSIKAAFFLRSFGISGLNTDDNYKKTSGLMIYGNDTIMISHVPAFKNGQPGFGHILSKGISLQDNTGHIAALQMVDRRYIWIRKDLPEKTRLVIGSFFCAILGVKDL